MSGLERITDHWTETVSDFILEQYKGASNWKAILKAVIDRYSEIEEQVWKLAPILDFKCRVKGELPTGDLLDFIAGIKNVERWPGETDTELYDRFLSEIADDTAGTPDNIIYNASLMSGDPEPVYLDEADCTFLMYTGPRPTMAGSEEIVTENNGDVVETESGDPITTEIGAGVLYGGGEQLTRKQVKNLAPAGVLGLPSDAIATWDEDEGESLLVDENGALLLMASDDDET